jgi:uncharacterized protein (DUF697 family)
MWKNIKSAFSVWDVLRNTSSSTLLRQSQMPVSLAIIASENTFERLLIRLGSPDRAIRLDSEQQIPEADGQILLDGEKLFAMNDSDFELSLARIALRHADRRIALAIAVPAFRRSVADQVSHEWALKNAKTAALSALPGVIPLTDWLSPVTSAGDLYILTKNQILLLLEVAACYGRPFDPKARIKELLPVVGGAFGWRAIARELIGLVPGGVGVAVKAGVAYAGTFTVGRAAAYYYSGGGQKMSDKQLGQVYRGAFTNALNRAKSLLTR